MGYSNGMIFAPVNTDDVRAVTGEPSDDIGTLYLSKRVNPHSLRRPVFTSLYDLTPAMLKTFVPKPGYNAGYGWKIGEITNSIDAAANSDVLWSHADPDVTSFQPLGLFDGYAHNVSISYGHTTVSGLSYRSYDGVLWKTMKVGDPFIEIYYQMKADNAGAAAVNEFFEGKELHIAVIRPNGVVDSATLTGTDRIIAKADKTLTFRYSQLNLAGEYLIVPLVLDKNGIYGTNTWYSLNICGINKCSVAVSTSSGITVSAMTTQLRTQYLYVSVTLRSTASSSDLIVNNKCDYEVYNSQGGIVRSGSVSFDNFSVPAGGSKTNDSAPGIDVDVDSNSNTITLASKVVLKYSGKTQSGQVVSKTMTWYPS